MKIETGTPTEPGLYVAYINSLMRRGTTDVMFLSFVTSWGPYYLPSGRTVDYEVLGWIGPLPEMKLAKIVTPVIDVDDLL